jgi:hypothetical protein
MEQNMKYPGILFLPPILFLVIVVTGCSKHDSNCPYPTFACLQGKWIEKEHTDGSSSLKEYIQVYSENNHEILYDWTLYAQLQTTQLAIGEYYFEALGDEDSVALTTTYSDYSYHRYLKMINENEIEISYEMQPGNPAFKKDYIRQ